MDDIVDRILQFPDTHEECRPTREEAAIEIKRLRKELNTWRRVNSINVKSVCWHLKNIQDYHFKFDNRELWIKVLDEAIKIITKYESENDPKTKAINEKAREINKKYGLPHGEAH